jgi:hypothetical protein
MLLSNNDSMVGEDGFYWSTNRSMPLIHNLNTYHVNANNIFKQCFVIEKFQNNTMLLSNNDSIVEEDGFYWSTNRSMPLVHNLSTYHVKAKDRKSTRLNSSHGH